MARSFLRPNGDPCTEAEACHNGAMRDGYRMPFDLMMMDSPGRMQMRDAAAAAEPPKSIDETLQRSIAASANSVGLKPSEWLAQRTPIQLEKLASEAAVEFLRTAGATGVASAFAMDAAAKASALALNSWRDASPSAPDALASQAAMRDAARAAHNGDYAPAQRLEAAAYAAVDDNAWRSEPRAADNASVRDLARATQY